MGQMRRAQNKKKARFAFVNVRPSLLRLQLLNYKYVRAGGRLIYRFTQLCRWCWPRSLKLSNWSWRNLLLQVKKMAASLQTALTSPGRINSLKFSLWKWHSSLPPQAEDLAIPPTFNNQRAISLIVLYMPEGHCFATTSSRKKIQTSLWPLRRSISTPQTTTICYRPITCWKMKGISWASWCKRWIWKFSNCGTTTKAKGTS